MERTQGFGFETRYLGALSYEGDMRAKRLMRRITVLADAADITSNPALSRQTSRLSLFSLNPQPLAEPKKARKIDPLTGFVR
ncbi:MAG TPA: hypothetical protein EYQ81_04675 [Sneathiellales bacterium]|jgi:hypothetical protein|nr:hypothetical protein [Sneathiellales bacterium]